MLGGDGEHERLVELVDTARSTVPAKPLTGDTVIVEDPEAPTFGLRLVGLAATAKSWNARVTVVVLPIEAVGPAVPTTVTVYVAAVVDLHDRFDVPLVTKVTFPG